VRMGLIIVAGVGLPRRAVYIGSGPAVRPSGLPCTVGLYKGIGMGRHMPANSTGVGTRVRPVGAAKMACPHYSFGS
jgi:hypothetical protein